MSIRPSLVHVSDSAANDRSEALGPGGGFFAATCPCLSSRGSLGLNRCRGLPCPHSSWVRPGGWHQPANVFSHCREIGPGVVAPPEFLAGACRASPPAKLAVTVASRRFRSRAWAAGARCARHLSWSAFLDCLFRGPALFVKLTARLLALFGDLVVRAHYSGRCASAKTPPVCPLRQRRRSFTALSGADALAARASTFDDAAPLSRGLLLICATTVYLPRCWLVTADG